MSKLLDTWRYCLDRVQVDTAINIVYDFQIREKLHQPYGASIRQSMRTQTVVIKLNDSVMIADG